MKSSVIFLSTSEVIHMHRIQIERFGGAHGVRDLGLLESAVHAPQAVFSGQFLHSSLLEMGAIYMYHLIKNHPFVDGNKRIGMIAGLTFLGFNDVCLSLTNEQVFLIGIGIAESKLSKEAIINILKKSESQGN